MSCRIRGELQSLRAAVKRFEDGSETAALIAAHEADQRRIGKLKTENDRMRNDLQELKRDNRLLKEEIIRTQSDYDLLTDKYTGLRNESEYESVINSTEFQETA